MGCFLSLIVILAAIFFLGMWFFNQESPEERIEKELPTAPVRGGWLRGDIYDRNRKELVVTIERVSVYVRSREIGYIAETAQSLASALSLDAAVVESQLKRGGVRIWIAEDITQEQEQAVKRLGLPGVYLQKGKKRYYPHGAHGAHILGFAENGVGLAGIEYRYDQLLARRNLAQNEAQEPLALQQDLVLALDLKIQWLLEEALSEIRRQGVSQGLNMKVAAYILDSRSGALIAGGQAPGFDPNNFAHYGRDILGNLFFKPVFLPQKFRVFFRDSAVFYKVNSAASVQGAWSVAVAEKKSGKQLQLMAGLGFDQPVAVDFFVQGAGQAEQKGRLIHKERALRLGLIPEVSTPMNLLVAMSSLLHGTPEHSPYAVSRVVDVESGENIETPRRKNLEREELPVDIASRIFEAMGTKRLGSAVYFRGQAVGQVPLATGGSEFVQNDVTFVNIPSGEHALALLLVVEVKGRGPFAKAKTRRKERLKVEEILDKKVQRIAILDMVTKGAEGLLKPEAGEYGYYQGEKRFSIEHGKVVPVAGGKKTVPAEMPDLKGLSLRKGLRLLQGAPVKLSITGSGRIVRQSPAPGTELKKGVTCQLFLEQGATIQFQTTKEEVE